MNIKTKNAKNGGTSNHGVIILNSMVYRKVDITQRFNIENIKETSQITVMEVKKVPYGGTLWKQ